MRLVARRSVFYRHDSNRLADETTASCSDLAEVHASLDLLGKFESVAAVPAEVAELQVRHFFYLFVALLDQRLSRRVVVQ